MQYIKWSHLVQIEKVLIVGEQNCKTKVEDFFIDIFLKHYNTSSLSNFKVIARPEKDQNIIGTFDYLCEDVESGEKTAVELTTLHKSERNVETNVNLNRFMAKLIEKSQNLSYPNLKRVYMFFVNFSEPPKISEKSKYLDALIDIVARSVKDYEQNKLSPLTYKVLQLPIIKEFKLHATHEGAGKIEFGWTCDDNFSKDILRDIQDNFRIILSKKNRRLKIAKEELFKTILLVINRRFDTVEWEMKNSFQSINQEEHCWIDEIYLADQVSSCSSFEIVKIK